MKKTFIGIIAIVIVIGIWYFTFAQKTKVVNEEPNPTPSSVVTATPSESEVIQMLLSTWKNTQAKFAVKAGESGTYNTPDKLQFISTYAMLVHYDDGLVDHISVIQYKNGAFTEVKNVGIMSTMSESEWHQLVLTYGNVKSFPSNYQSNSNLVFTKTSKNLFVK